MLPRRCDVARLWRFLAVAILLTFTVHPLSAAESAVGPLMKLFESGRLPPERQGTVVEMICKRGNEHDLRVVFDRLVKPDAFQRDLRLQTMTWLGDAANTRKVKPAGDLETLSTLVSDSDKQLQEAAIQLAAAWRVPSIAKSLEALATNPKTSPELQRVAISGLVALGDPRTKDTLVQLATAGPLQVRMQAAGGLVAIDLPTAAEKAAALLAEASPQDAPDEMLDAFFNRKDGANKLAAALKNTKLTVDVAKTALRYMYAVGRSDAELSNVLSAAAGVATDPPPPTPEEVAKLVQEVTAKGDPVRGEAVFRRKEVSCMRCHSVSRAGGQVGPDLSAVGGSSPTDYVVNSILNPNLAVKEQYVTKVFVLSSGLVLTGVVIDRDDTRVRIRDVQGKEVFIPTADIDEEVEGKSLMPQGITKFLTHDELVDLARFISDLGKPGAFAIRPTPSIQRWRVMKNPPKELTAEVPHLEHIRQFVLGSPPEQWLPAYARVGGVLPLHELRPGDKPTVLILQGEVQVNETGKVAFKVSSTENAQVWIDAEAFENQKEFVLLLEQGKHTVTARVEVSDRDAPELQIEVIKPTGSTAQFEVIGGT